MGLLYMISGAYSSLSCPSFFFPVAMDSSVGYFLIRFRKFLALIALPVPMLRQVYFDLSGSTFPHVFIVIFIKTGGNKVSGSTFSHVYLTFFLQLWWYPHVFLTISPVIFFEFPLGGLWGLDRRILVRFWCFCFNYGDILMCFWRFSVILGVFDVPLGCHGATVHDQWSIQFPLLPLLFFSCCHG